MLDMPKEMNDMFESWKGVRPFPRCMEKTYNLIRPVLTGPGKFAARS